MEPWLTRCRRNVADAILFHLRATKRLVHRSDPIYFCLNSGRCGSMSMVRLLRANGIRNCYHELQPDLLEQGVAYYHGHVPAETVAATLRKTRRGVFFEANNRLFALARPIRTAFPQARFVFLYRDGRDVVRSGLQRQWYQKGDRFGHVRLGAGTAGPAFEKACRYWTDVNQRILSDLRTMGCTYLAVRFEDLVDGRGTDQLAEFLQVPLSRCQVVPPTNGTATWSVPAYPQWSDPWREQFEEICGPTMRMLGYWTKDAPGGPEPHCGRPLRRQHPHCV